MIEYLHRLLAVPALAAYHRAGAHRAWSLIRRGDVYWPVALGAVVPLPLFLVQAAIGG